MAKIVVERENKITIIAIDRPEARNAVDPTTAVHLRAVFHAFEADIDQSVAILTGKGGTFCPGYDLNVAAERTGHQLHDPEGPRPMGPTRHLMAKPLIAVRPTSSGI